MNAREATRQRLLLRAIVSRGDGLALNGWVRESGARMGRGLAAYQANLGAAAERALAGTFPTVRQLMGDESFAAMARDFVRRCPPARGDLAWLGESLPAFIADAEALRSEPYLADVARLEWAVQRAESAADDDGPVRGLERLAGHEPSQLAVRFRAGADLLASPWPVARIWLAHRSDASNRFDGPRAAFAAGRGDTALVWRRGWRAQVAALDAADARFTLAAFEGRDLAAALDAAGSLFAFDAWLARALREGWIAGFDLLTPSSET
jgi:hypothetical protein